MAAPLPHQLPGSAQLASFAASHDSLAAYRLGNLSLHDFVLPEDERPITPFNHFPDEDYLPVVDFAAFAAGDVEVRRMEALEIMCKAAEGCGFFRLINHGVSADLISRVERHLELFFTLPLGEKMKGSRSKGSPYGYGAGTDAVKRNKWWVEILHVPWDKEADNFKKILQKVWPDEELYKDFCADVAKYMGSMQMLGHSLRELLSECLGLNPSYYSTSYEGENSSAMRFLYYPPCPQPELVMGIHGHTDPGTITILHQDSTGGLQILHNGNWVGVKPVLGSLIINLGDCFQVLSNGRFKSAVHRVVLNRDVARRSMVFFYNAKDDAIIQPAAELVGKNGPADRNLFRSITWREYRDAFLGGQEVGTKTIDFIKIPSLNNSEKS